MALSFAGNGTITGLSVGGLPDGCIASADIASGVIPAGGADTSLSNLSSAGEQMVVKAWVNFDGTGTVSIRDSYGVSSITDRGTGVYTVNFSSAFGNSLFNGTVSATIGGATNNNRVASTAPVSTTTAYLNTWEGSSANDIDVNHICGSYFGD